VEIERLLSYQS